MATTENWMYPPWGGWTVGQVRNLGLPFGWEMLDGVIAVRPQTTYWHDMVREQLRAALREEGYDPGSMRLTHRVAVDDRTLLAPDLVVCREPECDPDSSACPVGNVLLVVEVVAPESRTEDRYRKPGLLTDAGVPCYWRVERAADGVPVVHEYDGRPCRERWAEHRERLVTRAPFPVDIDLRGLVQR